MIFYFTATGNCLDIAKRLDKETYSIPQIKGHNRFKADRIGVIAPTYAFDIPDNVKEFLKNNEFETDYFYIICTFGNKSGGIEQRVQKFLHSIGKKADYINSILMVDNFLPGYDISEQLIMDKKIDENFEIIKQDIENRKNFVKPETEEDKKDYEIMLSYNLDYKFMNKYIVTEDCIGCEICTKVCPKSCFEIVDKRAKQDNTNCLTCLACVNACPKKALKFPIPNERFPISEPNPNVRFKNENVTLQEIIKANCQNN